MKLKAIHIVVDEKFIDGAISLFETDERVENTYVIISEKEIFSYLKTPGIIRVANNEVLDLINKFDVVFIHSLPAIPLYLIPKIRKDIKLIWLAWGYDFYEKPFELIKIKLIGEETFIHTKFLRLKQFLYWRNRRKAFLVRLQMKKVIKRIDYFSGVFPYEYLLLKEANPAFRAKPLDFYYGATDFFIPESPSAIINYGKKNIIIGNSANITGNHLDVLKTISSVPLDKDAKIIIPLSYGGPVSYINKVEEYAEKIAPGQVISLKKYLPLNEYLELISNCKVAVFAHERQQATDNIFMQLIYGARVYMSETSMAYAYLKSIGLKVYSLQSDLNLFNDEMDEEDILTNRRILSEQYSSSKLINRVQVIYSKLIDDLQYVP